MSLRQPQIFRNSSEKKRFAYIYNKRRTAYKTFEKKKNKYFYITSMKSAMNFLKFDIKTHGVIFRMV